MAKKVLDDRHTIKIGEEDRHLFMSYGLLDELAGICGNNPDDALMLESDGELRAAAVNALLAERDENGQITKPVNAFTLEVDPAAISNMLNWAMELVFDFLLKALEKASALGKKNEARVKVLQSTLTGSPT